MNPYLELEISIDASDDEIKQKYRSLAMMHHPDKGGDEETFKRIKEAYEILSDPIRRKAYDISGNADSNIQIKNDAMEYINHMTVSIIPNFDPEKDNLIILMKNEVNKNLVENHNNINICNNYIKHLEKVIRRINTRGKKQNVILEIVERQVDTRKQELNNFNHRIKVCKLVNEILNDYEYGLVDLPALP